VHLAILGLLHFDGFAPRAQRPDDFTVDYLLLRPVVGPSHGCLQRLVKPWVIWDGPKSVLSLEPIVDILRGQCIACLKDGVSVLWPVGAPRTAGDWVAPEPGEVLHVTFVVGGFAGDQPATQTFNGHMSHNGLMGCRWGSIVKTCMGSTLTTDLKQAGFDLDALKCLVKKKGVEIPDKKKVTWHRHSPAEMMLQASVLPAPEQVREAQEAAGDLDLSFSARSKLAKENGWSYRGYMARMLHDLTGFDQQMDVLIDGMHNWMNVIKPCAHMTVDILLGTNEEYWLDELLQDIRRMLPGCFTSGRRVTHVHVIAKVHQAYNSLRTELSLQLNSATHRPV
jgi:hypothetical protein